MGVSYFKYTSPPCGFTVSYRNIKRTPPFGGILHEQARTNMDRLDRLKAGTLPIAGLLATSPGEGHARDKPGELVRFASSNASSCGER